MSEPGEIESASPSGFKSPKGTSKSVPPSAERSARSVFCSPSRQNIASVSPSGEKAVALAFQRALGL